MKKLLLLSSLVVLLLTGCAQKEVVVKTEYVKVEAAKFPIEEFEEILDYDVKNIQVFEENGVKYIKIPLTDFMDLIAEYKKNKSKYNLLRESIIEFNRKETDESNRQNQ